MFDKLKKAHEVLSDPQRRAVYDRFGKEGLDGRAGATDAEASLG